jgi:hypothetical protein
MRLAFAPLVVAHGTCHTVGEPQPKGKHNVQYNGGEQHHLKNFNHIVCAHEMAECTVPRTVVVTQYAEVGTGMKQKEDEQKPSQQGYAYLLRDGMDSW